MASGAEQWREWLARHGPALLLFARQWTTCDADAEDAVQEGFVRFWRSHTRAREPVAYLYACVRNAAIDQVRCDAARQKRMDVLKTSDPAASRFAPDQGEWAEMIEASMTRLPPEQREVVVMKIWGGLTFAEIATALKISPNTAASRYRYAIERLEAAFAPEFQDQPTSES